MRFGSPQWNSGTQRTAPDERYRLIREQLFKALRPEARTSNPERENMYQASDKFTARMSMAGSAPDRMALLERWRQLLKDAKIRYAFAQNYAKEVMDDFRSGGISATTEMFACQKAIRAEAFALREYDRVLRIVTDLALNGKVPVEDDPPKYAKID